MKKNIIALAIASAVAAPAAFAGAPTVYGKINMSVDNITDNGTSVGSNASRIGVKGASDLGNGLKAIYKMEFGVDVDTTDNNGGKTGTGLTGRNAYLGLAGGFGAVLLGRHDTPMKMSQAKDLFNDGYGDAKPMAGGLGVNGAAGEVRASNVIAYVSPSFSGVKIVVAGVSAENNSSSSLTNVYSIAAMYGSKKKGVYLSAAVNGWDKAVSGGTSDATETRVSAQYTAGGLMANVMYQSFDNTKNDISIDPTTGKFVNINDGLDGSNIQVNFAYEIGKLTPKVKYSTVSYDIAGASDASAYGVGADYSLGKKTTAYVEYVSTDDNLYVKGYNDKVASSKSFSFISVGMSHKF